VGFLGLCEKDELVDSLRDVFNANILRMPEERVHPLCVIARKREKVRYWGKLADLVKNGSAVELKPGDFSVSSMPDLSGKKSREVHTGLGLKILGGFLQGFGLPSGAIKSQFKKVSKVSFSFRDVERRYINPAQIGALIRGSSIDESNRSNSIFLKEGYELLVIDMVITSKDFSIFVEEKEDNKFSLDVEAIEDIVGKTHTAVEVSTFTGLDLQFKGPRPLTFAFSCVLFKLNLTGDISSITPGVSKPLTFSYPAKSPLKTSSGKNVLLSPQPALLSWDQG
jgi:hypothetical protein